MHSSINLSNAMQSSQQLHYIPTCFNPAHCATHLMIRCSGSAPMARHCYTAAGESPGATILQRLLLLLL
jgi:hypothetical protein